MTKHYKTPKCVQVGVHVYMCMDVYLYLYLDDPGVSMCVCTRTCSHVVIDICTYVRMYVRMYIRACVRMALYTDVHPRDRPVLPTSTE